MQRTKKIIAGLACTLLPLVLLSFGALMSVHHTLSDPETVKRALSESAIYETFVEKNLGQTGERVTLVTTDQIPLDDPQIEEIVREAVPPEVIEAQANSIIDNFYAWLRGETPSVEFTLDLADSRIKLAEGLATYAADRAASLPRCTNTSDYRASFDPFNAACLPQGITTDQVGEQVRSEVASNQSLLRASTIDGSSLAINNSQEVQIGDLRINRNLYQKLETILYASGAAAVVLSLMILLCSATLRSGVRRLAVIGIVIGALSALLSGAISFIMASINPPAASETVAAFQQSAVDAIRLLTAEVRNWWLIYGLSLCGAGILALIILGITKPEKGTGESIARPNVSGDPTPPVAPQNTTPSATILPQSEPQKTNEAHKNIPES